MTLADDWAAGEYDSLVGQDRVVPYVFPTPGMLDGLPFTPPTATHARAGVWCYDTMTLVGPGTWTAARAAVEGWTDDARARAEADRLLAALGQRPKGAWTNEDLAAAGKVRSHVSRTGPLTDLPAILEELEGARYLGRAVVTDLAR